MSLNGFCVKEFRLLYIKTCTAACTCMKPSRGFSRLTDCDVNEGVCLGLVLAGRGWVGETAVQARYVVNSRKHSYYAFCCSVSPVALSLPSAPTLFPSLLTSVCLLFLFSPYMRALAYTHTPTYVLVCMCNHILLSLSPLPQRQSHPFPLLIPAQSFPL